MDLTKSSEKIKTYKYLNGETVNYSVCFFAVSFLFLILKQLFKITFSFSAELSVGISAAICAVVLFFLEGKFVFNHVKRGKLSKQAVLYVFRCAVDFGFYKIASFVFDMLLKNESAFTFFVVFFIYYFFNYYFDRLIVFDCVKKAAYNKGGRCYKLFWNNRFVLLSMGVFAISLGTIYLAYSAFPFGERTILRMDLYHQYGPLFCELYDRVVNHQSFAYSWISGGGSSFLGNYFNYLSSPLSFIVLLFERKEMPYAITTIVAVKGMLSAGTFTSYLSRSFKRHSAVTACFGVFYAMSGYFLAYYWNVMWLDGMILLPLIVLGIERIINCGKPALYIGSLAVLFYATYYMAYMVCIFSVIYFVVYYNMKYAPLALFDKTKEFNKRYSAGRIFNYRFLRTGCIFAFASLFAALLCAVTLIPVYMVLQGSSATSDDFPTSFRLYQDLLNIITSHLGALETTIRSSGEDVLPNIFSGLLSVILLPLYILNKKISVREKAGYVFIILLFVFSFNNNMANFIWHAFHFPNDLPFRFSFMYVFIFLVMAFRAFTRIKGFEYRDVAISGMFWVFMVILLQKYQTNKMTDKTIYISLLLIMLWTAFMLLVKNKKLNKTVLSALMVLLVFVEILACDMSSILFHQRYRFYTQNYDTYRKAIAQTYDNDDSFYRLELSELNTRMDTCLYGYRGMSTFSSMAYEQYSRNQYSLGMYGNRINSYTYNTQTPVYNMFYSLKYIMATEYTDPLSPDFYEQKYVIDGGKCDVYENKYFLPLAFTVSPEISKVEIEEGNPFEVQEDLIDRACGTSDVFVPVTYIETEGEDIDCEDVTENGTYYFSKTYHESPAGSIDIKLKTVTDSNLYIYITSPQIENVNYYSKKSEHTDYQSIDTPFIKDLGKHKKGDTVTVSLECGSIESDSSYFEIYAYNIDYDKLVSAYELLNEGAMNITSYSDTRISGTVNAGYNGYLYTSIPYDEGWSVYIDGEEQSTFKIGEAQLACEITEGKHDVEFRYEPRGLVYGALGTCAAWGAVIGYFAVKLIKKRKNAVVENS